MKNKEKDLKGANSTKIASKESATIQKNND